MSIAALGMGVIALLAYGVALAIPIFLLVLALRAVKALEASARAQQDSVMALRSIANSQSNEENR
ncbi:MAG: hypothetical protein WCP06_05880 [Verrucomicrobiota bacterium]